MENFVFTVYNKQQTEEIVSSDNKRQAIRKTMKLSESNEKDEILLDFYENVTNFCVSNDFTLEKLSCLLGILSKIVQNSLTNSIPLSTSQENFKSLLTKHSIQRPPFSIQVFSPQELKSISNFIENTFFKNYFLYSYGFTQSKDIVITTEKLSCSTFPVFSSLNEGNEINAETIQELKDYLPRVPTPKESKQELNDKEIEHPVEEQMDPGQVLLNSEIKNIKSIIEERVKKQDEEIFSKIELLKK